MVPYWIFWRSYFSYISWFHNILTLSIGNKKFRQIPFNMLILLILVWAIISVMKHHDQNKFGRKRLICLTFSYHHLDEVMTVTHGGSLRQEWCRIHGGMLFTDLLPLACSVSFLIESRASSPVVVPPTIDWTLSHQSPRKCPTSWPAGKLMEAFPQLGHSSLRWL